MRPAVKPIPQIDTRFVTPADVRQWFGRKPPSEAVCIEIAAGLTKMRWSSDPPLPVLGDGMRWTLAALPSGKADWLQLPPGEMTWEQTPDPDPDPYWDFEAATGAAKTLLASFPRMLRHWDRLSVPETRAAGYEAITTLDDALKRALPFIGATAGSPQRDAVGRLAHTSARDQKHCQSGSLEMRPAKRFQPRRRCHAGCVSRTGTNGLPNSSPQG